MASFDQKGALGDKFGQHPTEHIPAELKWEEMGPKIQAVLQEKRRRRPMWWWFPSALVVLVILVYFARSPRVEITGSFPLPLVAELPSYVADQDAANFLLVGNEGQGQSQPDEEPLGNKPLGSSAAVSSGLSPAAQRFPSAEAEEPSLPLGHSRQRLALAPKALLSSPALLPHTVPSRSTSPSSEQYHAEAPSAASGSSSLAGSEQRSSRRATVLASPFLASLLPSALPLSSGAERIKALPELPKTASIGWLVELEGGGNLQLRSAPVVGAIPALERSWLSGFTAGIRLGRKIQHTPYTIWTGVSVGSIVQKEQLFDVIPVRLYQPGTIDTIFRNTLTDEETIVYTDTVGGTRALRIQQHNSFRSWAIPLMIGRTWGQGRWQLAVQTGADLHLAAWGKGKYLSANYELLDTPEARSVGLAFRLETQILLPAGRLGRPFVRGAYRHFLYQTAGLTPDDTFRPQSGALTLGWQLRF